MIARCSSCALLVIALTAWGAAPPAPFTPQQKKELLAQRDDLLRKASALLSGGKRQDALQAIRNSVRVQDRLSGRWHSDAAEWRRKLAKGLEAIGAWDEAIELLREVIEIRRELAGPADWRTRDAVRDCRDALVQARMNDEHRRKLSRARRLDESAQRLYAQGKPSEAVKPARQAVALAKEVLGEKHAEHARFLNNLAVFYMDSMDFGNARALAEKSLRLRKEVLGEKHPEYAEGLQNMALLCSRLGDHAEARLLYEHALAVWKETVGEKNIRYAIALTNLGSLYRKMGDYPRGSAAFEKALILWKETVGEKHRYYATCLNNLAALYRAVGDHGRSRALLERSLRLSKDTVGEKHPNYATTLDNLSLLCKAMEDPDKASAYAERAQRLWTSLGKDHPGYLQNLTNRAKLLLDLEKFDKAQPLFEEVLRKRRETFGKKHPAYADALNDLALFWAYRGDVDKARSQAEMVLRVCKEGSGENHPHSIRAMYNLATIDSLGGQPSRAIERIIKASALLHAHIESTFPSLSHEQRILLLGQGRQARDLLLYLRPGKLPAARAYDHVLAWRGLVSSSHAEQQLERDRPALAGYFRDLREARAGLARLTNSPPGANSQAAWLDRWQSLQEGKDRAEIALSRASEEFRRRRARRLPNSKMVAAVLPRDTAFVDLVEYSWTERRLAAFIVRAGQPVVCHELGPAGEITAAVRAWQSAFTGRTIGVVDSRAAARLRQRVWLPIQMALGDCKKVLIAPDGALCQLSFAALPGNKRDSWLLEEYTIAYVTSGRHLLELADPPAGHPSAGLLAVGGLDFGKGGGDPTPSSLADLPRNWPALPGSKHEVQRIIALYRQAFPTAGSPTLRTGIHADADRLANDLTPGKNNQRYRYVHLATHGLYVPPRKALGKVDPGLLSLHDPRQADQFIHDYSPLLRTFVALSNANRRPEAGIWRGEEIAGLDLRGVEVVVLSACRTAEGKVIAGEGMQGLQRACQAAGARNLVASLWKVHDSATSVLMEEFYRQLWIEKRSAVEALRQAQLFVLNNPEKVEQRQKDLHAAGVRDPEEEAVELPKPRAGQRTHPMLWAPFVLSGGLEPAKR